MSAAENADIIELVIRLAKVLSRFTLLGVLAIPIDAVLAQPGAGFEDSPVAGLRDVPVGDDLVSLLIVAESFELAYRSSEARSLREFVERLLWLQALGEPRPTVTNVGEVLAGSQSEPLSTLRRRGAARALEIVVTDSQTVAMPSSAEALVKNGLDTLLIADLAITNHGAVAIAAVQIGLYRQTQPGVGTIHGCGEHGLDPILSGETRAVRCYWPGAATDVQALGRLLAAHDPASPTITTEAVLFDVAGRRIPYNLNDIAPGRVDIELRRAALDSGPASCRVRGDCNSSLGDLAALLPWMLVATLLGWALGRRMSTA